MDSLACKEYPYVLSCDLNLDVMIKLRSLTLSEDDAQTEPAQEMYVTAQILVDERPIHAVAQCTHAASVPSANGQKVFWGEWLTLPIKYIDLHLNSMVQIIVWKPGMGQFGSACVNLFDEHSRLRRGRVQIPMNVDGTYHETDTEMLRSRIWRIGERYNHDEILKISWLDSLARNRTSEISLEVTQPDEIIKKPIARSRMLTIEFPYFDCPVLFEERPYFSERMDAILMRSHEEQEERERTLSLTSTYDEFKEGFPWASHFSVFHDPEIFQTYGRTMDGKEMINPVEEKYRQLNPSLVRGVVDKNLKPNKNERAKLNQIIESSGNLSRRNEDLLWKFCYSLTTDKRALVKFVMSVNWDNEAEVQIGEELLHEWARIDMADALRLLSDEPEFRNPIVRSHAIRILDLADDSELQLYLLQLVQALRYDDIVPQTTSERADSLTTEEDKWNPGLLASFLIHRALSCESLVSYFTWYLATEIDNKDNGVLFRNVQNELMKRLTASPSGRNLSVRLAEQMGFVRKVTEMCKEGRGRAITRQNYLQRILQQEDSAYHYLCKLTCPVMYPLWPMMQVAGLKPEALRVFSSKTQPIKLDFSLIDTNGNQVETEHSAAMFKVGDDLRQDQLVLQLFGVMDKMFKDVNLDLHLTLYRVLSFSSDVGMMEFVQGSQPLTAIAKQYGTIRNFFKKQAKEIVALEHDRRKKLILQADQTGENRGDTNPSLPRLRTESETYDDMVNRFIKSCAGYCMCTYVLCVGDRHLDNIMLKSTGELFHIDFGYIFGHDPRSWAVSPIRLTRDMIDTMGGRGSKGFDKFVSYCSQAYRVLRANAPLILNLLHLMKDSKMDNLFDDHEAVIQIVRDRFELDRTDHSAEIWLLEKLNRCEDTFVTTISDALHNANVFLN